MFKMVLAIRLAWFLKRYSGHTLFQAIKKAFFIHILSHKATCKTCGCIITVSYKEYPECIDCIHDKIYTEQSEYLDIDLDDIDFDDDILSNFDIRPDCCKACMEVDCCICPDTKYACTGDCFTCGSFGTHVCKTYNEVFNNKEVM